VRTIARLRLVRPRVVGRRQAARRSPRSCARAVESKGTDPDEPLAVIEQEPDVELGTGERGGGEIIEAA
jgi:hypothetical protein